MNNFIFIYITNPTKTEAKNIARHLLNKKLIACANIYSGVKSLYRWQGRIAEETEFVLILKTIDKNFGAVKKEVEKIHSYKIPCIVKIPASSNKKYFDWLRSQVNI